MTVWVPFGDVDEDDLVPLARPRDDALVHDALPGGRPHRADPVHRSAEVGDERPVVVAVGVDEPEPGFIAVLVRRVLVRQGGAVR